METPTTNIANEFRSKNVARLKAIEKENPAIFMVIQNTLNFIDRKYNGGISQVDIVAPPVAPAPEAQQPAAGENTGLIQLQQITLLWAEGTGTFDGQTETTWEGMRDVMKHIYKGPNQEGYYKSKISVLFADGEIVEPRIDIGPAVGDYNPETMDLGRYVKRIVDDSGDSNKYQWTDSEPAAVAPAAAPATPEKSREEIEAEIAALEMSITFTEESEKPAIEAEIEALKISLNFV